MWFTDGIQDAIATLGQPWLGDYSNMAWMLNHPGWSIGLIIGGVFVVWLVFSSVFEAIRALLREMMLFLMRSPFALFVFLFQKIANLFKSQNNLEPAQKLETQDPQKRLQEILDRLEILRQEEASLIQEAKSLLEVKP